jgi:hypothetical protein
MPAEDLELQRALALRAVTGGLLRLRWLAAATRCELAMHRHMRALKYGYNPDQPLVPKHEDGAGRWTLTDANGNPATQRRVRVAGDVPTNDPPEVPKERPKTSPERSAAVRFASKILGSAATVVEVVKLGTWLAPYASGIISYNDPPKSLDELRQAVSTPDPGYDIHHIVERSSALKSGYPVEVVDGPDNLVRIPRMKHWDINSWYGTPTPEFGGQSPRDYLSGRNWDVRMQVGLEALRENGVLKR